MSGCDQNMMFSEKDPDEVINYGVDFSELLESSEVVSSGSVVMSAYMGTDVSAASMLIGAPFVSNAVLGHRVQGGLEGVVYRFKAIAVTSTNRILVGAGYIPVNEP